MIVLLYRLLACLILNGFLLAWQCRDLNQYQRTKVCCTCLFRLDAFRWNDRL